MAMLTQLKCRPTVRGEVRAIIEDPVPFDEYELRLNKAFSKRIRLVAENPHAQFSSTWMFWGNNSDFYFGAKSMLGSFKVSLHENGHGYVAFHNPYFLKKRDEGIDIPTKTVFEWALPKPTLSGVVHAASLILPADYCFAAPLNDRSRRNTLVLGIEDGCCAEIGVFHGEQSSCQPRNAR